jgi:hypothetical protein
MLAVLMDPQPSYTIPMALENSRRAVEAPHCPCWSRRSASEQGGQVVLADAADRRRRHSARAIRIF